MRDGKLEISGPKAGSRYKELRRSPVPLSELKQPKPPQPPRSQLSGILIYAIFGLLIGLVVQEFRWRGSIMVPLSVLQIFRSVVDDPVGRAGARRHPTVSAADFPICCR